MRANIAQVDTQKEVSIVGGGLAGLSAALSLAKAGKSVIVYEKRTYPCLKLCGEFLSVEGLNALSRMTGNSFEELREELRLLELSKFAWVSRRGQVLKLDLDPPGFSVRRDHLDFWLANQAIRAGAEVRFNSVIKDVNSLKSVSKKVFCASGKERSEGVTPYFAVKGYVSGKNFQHLDMVLFQLSGGYIGFAKQKNPSINADELSYCALLDRRKIAHKQWHFTKWDELIDGVFKTNSTLSHWAETSKPTLLQHVGSARFDFERRDLEKDGVWYLGDAAQLMPPFVGDGMAAAIEAGELSAKTWMAQNNESGAWSKVWKKNFGRRVFWAKLLHPFVNAGLAHEFWLAGLRVLPGSARLIYRVTR